MFVTRLNRREISWNKIYSKIGEFRMVHCVRLSVSFVLFAIFCIFLMTAFISWKKKKKIMNGINHKYIAALKHTEGKEFDIFGYQFFLPISQQKLWLSKNIFSFCASRNLQRNPFLYISFSQKNNNQIIIFLRTSI